MAEVRVQAEGTVWWVQASGSGRTWATATGPASGLVGFVKSLSFTSAQTIVTMMERGQPDHHKITQKTPPEITMEFLWTGSFLTPTATGSGASLPMFHLEFRASAVERGAGTGEYFQFHGCALTDNRVTEQEDGNRVSLTFRALAMNGPTASGYIK